MFLRLPEFGMNKKPITVQGQYDHLFVDDRDERIASMSVTATQPRYGASHLQRPIRALSPREVEAMDAIGLPVDPTAAE